MRVLEVLRYSVRKSRLKYVLKQEPEPEDRSYIQIASKAHLMRGRFIKHVTTRIIYLPINILFEDIT